MQRNGFVFPSCSASVVLGAEDNEQQKLGIRLRELCTEYGVRRLLI